MQDTYNCENLERLIQSLKRGVLMKSERMTFISSRTVSQRPQVPLLPPLSAMSRLER